jgi:RND family efflux transporter MFP subunit
MRSYSTRSKRRCSLFPPMPPPVLPSQLTAIVTAATLVIVCVAGCQRAAVPNDKEVVTPVAAYEATVVEARLEAWPETIRIQGSLLADEDALIGTKIAGRVKTVEVDLGSTVKRDAVLVELDRSELELLVKQAEAELRQACAAIGLTPDKSESELDLTAAPPVMLEQALVEEAQAAADRAKQLLPTNAISATEFDAVVAQLKASQARHASAIHSVSEQISLIGVRRAELALARQRLADAIIVAPFDAIVESRHVSPGEYLQVGQSVVSLVRVDRLRFTAGVPERRAAAIRVGQPVHLHFSGSNRPLMARITRVSPMVLQTSRSVRIEADVANADLQLQAGLFAEADVVVDAESQALSLPEAAISQFAGVQKVWLVADGQAQRQTVRTGRRGDGRVEILEGVAPKSLVIANAAKGRAGPVVAKLATSGAGVQVSTEAAGGAVAGE